MKRFKYCAIGVCLLSLVIAIAININLSSGKSQANDVIFGNMEALAQGEGGDWGCKGSGNVDCRGAKYEYNLTR